MSVRQVFFHEFSVFHTYVYVCVAGTVGEIAPACRNGLFDGIQRRDAVAIKATCCEAG